MTRASAQCIPYSQRGEHLQLTTHM